MASESQRLAARIAPMTLKEKIATFDSKVRDTKAVDVVWAVDGWITQPKAIGFLVQYTLKI